MLIEKLGKKKTVTKQNILIVKLVIKTLGTILTNLQLLGGSQKDTGSKRLFTYLILVYDVCKGKSLGEKKHTKF